MGAIAGIVSISGEAPGAWEHGALIDALAVRDPAAPSVCQASGAWLGQRGGGLVRLPDAILALDGRLTRDGARQDAARWLGRWSVDGLRALTGLDAGFAAAIWEPIRQALWLIRDPYGSRPLYYWRYGGMCAFASEIPALTRLPRVSAEIAYDHLSEYLSFRYVHAPRTLLRDVAAVPPGHAVRIDASGVRAERWASLAWVPPRAPIPEANDTARRVDEALHRAVGRASAEGPVGVLLSGGLDSSAILFHARAGGRTPPAYTVALSGDPTDESPFAGRVARVLGAEHHLVRLDRAAIIDAVDQTATAMGQPLPTAAAVLQGLLYREAARDVGVLLSGDGGDEQLGGRHLEQVAMRLRSARALDALPPGVRGLGRTLARAFRQEATEGVAEHYGLKRRIGGSAVFEHTERAALLTDPGLVRPGLRRAILEPLYREVQSDPINEILHVWQRGLLTEDSLARSDRLAMRAGLEVRYPLLDREFALLCAGLPGEAKVRARGLGYRTKWPLRQAMAGRIPPQLLHRPKRSAPAPLDHWLRTDGAGFLAERAASLARDPDGLFRAETVHALAEQHRAGQANHGVKLWTLILFDAWRRGLKG